MRPGVIIRVNVPIVTIRADGVEQPSTTVALRIANLVTARRRVIIQANVPIVIRQIIGMLHSRMMA